MFKLEISTYNIEGVKESLRLGVDRLELCDNIKEGGTTPSYGFVRSAVEVGHPNICVIVRPRGGDFLYDNTEFNIIKEDILALKELGVQGIVCGVLNPDGSVDVRRTKELVELAHPMEFTFHRAFDMTNDPVAALEDLISIGVHRVLTSGLENTALEGKNVIKQLVKQAQGRIAVMAGSGVNGCNLIELHSFTGVEEFHMSAVKEVKSAMQFFNHRLSLGNVESHEYLKLTADSEKIEKAMESIRLLKRRQGDLLVSH